jgi:predicted DsbA family dithiol-disulfide isomerase
MTPVRLDIFSDPVCPWCYLGKANLDRALERRPGHPFVIEWHPFRLNPRMPRGGVERRPHLIAKFGGEDRLLEAEARLVQMARAAGVDLDLARATRLPDTTDAHRLIHWAGLEGRQTAMVGRLFRAYWREGQDIGAPEVLARLAGEAGMDAGLVARLLAGEADRDTVEARDAHARARGVTGVPLFLVAERHAVTGAHPSELWERVIDELAAAQNGSTPSSSG